MLGKSNSTAFVLQVLVNTNVRNVDSTSFFGEIVSKYIRGY